MQRSIRRNFKNSIARLTAKKLKEILPSSSESRLMTSDVSPLKIVVDKSNFRLKSRYLKNYTPLKGVSNLKSNDEPLSSLKEPLSAARSGRNYQELKQQRINSLESLVKRCKKVQEDLKQTGFVTKFRKIETKAAKLKSSIELCQNMNNTDLETVLLRRQSEKDMKTEFKLIRNELSFKERPSSRNRSVWKFSRTATDRKTDKIIGDLIGKYKLTIN